MQCKSNRAGIGKPLRMQFAQECSLRTSRQKCEETGESRAGHIGLAQNGTLSQIQRWLPQSTGSQMPHLPVHRSRHQRALGSPHRVSRQYVLLHRICFLPPDAWPQSSTSKKAHLKPKEQLSLEEWRHTPYAASRTSMPRLQKSSVDCHAVPASSSTALGPNQTSASTRRTV